MARSINEIIFERDGRIFLNDEGMDYDITTYTLIMASQYYQKNNFHITKFPHKDGTLEALIYTEDKEVMDFAEQFYNIDKTDFRRISRKAESAFLTIDNSNINSELFPNFNDVEE